MIYAFHRFGWASGGVSVSIFWGVYEERGARMFAAVLDRRAAFLDLQRPPAHDDGRPGRN
jgi:hypothetical protein